MSKQTIFKVLPVIILSSLLTVAIIYAWREPTQAPPGGNVPTPINVGRTTQFKAGGLGVGGVFQAHGGTANPVLTVVDGNVGIGTTNPGALLEVSGQIKITGGSPGANKVLTSDDASGLASWRSKLGFPPGVIIIYSGPWDFDNTGLGTDNLSGWALCNGVNGTPNLSNRFVLGTTSPQKLGKTGGDNFYSLTVEQLPPHTHTIKPKPNGSHTSHTHRIKHRDGKAYGTGCFYGAFLREYTDRIGFWHCMDGPVTQHPITTEPTGDGAFIDNRPAYIQLAYIMKL